jgi:hypothetical protein
MQIRISKTRAAMANTTDKTLMNAVGFYGS